MIHQKEKRNQNYQCWVLLCLLFYNFISQILIYYLILIFDLFSHQNLLDADFIGSQFQICP